MVLQNQEWIEASQQASLVYRCDGTFLNVTDLINKHKLVRILARVQYVKANLAGV
jgi:hypothetical protein